MTNNYNSLNPFHLDRMKLISRKKIAMLLFFVFFSVLNSQAQIAVTVDNPTNTTPNLSAGYTSLALALTDLNAVSGMTGPVTLTLAAGSETAPASGLTIGSATLNLVLSAANNVKLVAAGSVVLNAGVGTATPASAAPDGVLKIVGADWITLDGITFTDANVANPATMEFGVGLFKLSLSDGASNNTIQNCIFNMQRINNANSTAPMVEGSVGILAINATASAATTVLVPTTAAGSNSNNKFYTNTINGGNIGIALIGYAAATPFTSADTNNDVGGSSLATGNTVLNYGGGAVANPAAGIRTLAQYGINVSYNTVNNNDGAGVNHATTLRGIYLNAATSASATVNNNTVTVKSAGTTSALTAIENASGSTAASNTININNNNIINCSYTTATSGIFSGVINSATAATVNVNGNTIDNNTIGTSGSANACVFQGISNTANLVTQVFSASSNTITNNSILNSFGTFYGIRAATQSVTCNLNTISNIGFPNGAGTTAVIAYGIYDLSSPTTENYTNNTISNFTVSGSNTSTSSIIYGIHSNTVSGSNIVVSGNAISGFAFNNSSTGSAALRGISLTTATTMNVFKNKIHDLSAAGAASVVSGITILGVTTANTYNNIIGNLTTPTANASNPLIGINVTGGTTFNAYYNTVYLNGSSSGALFGSSAISTATGTTVDLRNNIFVNNSTVAGAGLAVAYRRSSTTLTSYAAASNNNLFYASNIFTDGTNTDATLAAFKTRVGSRDTASISENPTFLSIAGANVNFLHIDTAVSTQIESGAASIATYTDDFDGNLRNATTPDIGADEFSGILLDLISPSISYTPFVYTCDGSVNRTLTASITDATGVATSGIGLPVLYWRINAGAWNSATGTFVSGSTYTFSFGAGAVTSDVVSYYVVAQDTAGTPNIGASPSAGAVGFTVNPPAVGTPPTTPNSYVVNSALTGVYTVGASGVYPTLAAAVSAYNSSCLTGPVTFSLIDATYPSETFPITINQNNDANAVNTLTIKPAVGVVSTISGSLNNALLILNGADYVNINGSSALATASACLVGGDASLRELTIQNTNVGTGAGVISVQSGTNGAMNNVIKNVNVLGQDSTTTLIGIALGGNTLGSVGTDNDNNRVENCSVQKSIFGIYSGGLSLANQNSGTVIKQNDLSGTATNRIRRVGILMFNDNGADVSYNNIAGIDSNESADVVGIAMGNQAIDATIVTNGGITGAVVSNNKISGVNSNASAGFSAAGITIAGAPGGFNTLRNNMISGVMSNGTSPDFPSGIYVVGAVGSDTRIYNNTVSMSGDRGATAAQMPTYCISVTGADEALQLKNNIFVTSQTASGGGANAKSYAIGLARSTFANLDSNYNDFVSSGANDGGFRSGSLGVGAGTEYATVALWATAVSDDANSVEIAPVFLSASDLHLDMANNLTLDNLGTPIAAVTTDYDCEARNATTPDMGADEFTPPLQVVDFNGANAFKLYPNPVSNILNIEYTSELTNVTVYNMLGQQVLAKKVTAASTQVDMSGLNAGTYLVKVEANSVSKTLKVVKQ